MQKSRETTHAQALKHSKNERPRARLHTVRSVEAQVLHKDGVLGPLFLIVAVAIASAALIPPLLLALAVLIVPFAIGPATLLLIRVERRGKRVFGRPF